MSSDLIADVFGSAFLIGILGSVAVEILDAYKIYVNDSEFPSRYRKVGFYAVRAFLAVLGGFLAHAHGAETALLAFHIGAATPLMLQALGQRLPD